jgi:hypothetical protein
MQALLDQSGTDITHIFHGIHPGGTLESALDPEQRIGRLDQAGEQTEHFQTFADVFQISQT